MQNWFATVVVLLLGCSSLGAQQPAPQTPAETPSAAANPEYDPALAARVGADDHGMRRYVLVILESGPTRVPDGPERDQMFAGHFANMKRLSAEGKLALAGPLDGVDGWRGLFVLAVEEIEEAEEIVATDPVVIRGEMVARYHGFYGSAALMLVAGDHQRVMKESF